MVEVFVEFETKVFVVPSSGVVDIGSVVVTISFISVEEVCFVGGTSVVSVKTNRRIIDLSDKA